MVLGERPDRGPGEADEEKYSPAVRRGEGVGLPPVTVPFRLEIFRDVSEGTDSVGGGTRGDGRAFDARCAWNENDGWSDTCSLGFSISSSLRRNRKSRP